MIGGQPARDAVLAGDSDAVQQVTRIWLELPVVQNRRAARGVEQAREERGDLVTLFVGMRQHVVSQREIKGHSRIDPPSVVHPHATGPRQVDRRGLQFQLVVLERLAQQEAAEFVADSAALERELALRRPEQVLLLEERHVLGAEADRVVAARPQRVVAELPRVEHVRPRPGAGVDVHVQRSPEQQVRNPVRAIVRIDLRNTQRPRAFVVARRVERQRLARETHHRFVHDIGRHRRGPLDHVLLRRIRELGADRRIALVGPLGRREDLAVGVHDEPEHDAVLVVHVMVDAQDFLMHVQR